MRIFPAVDIKGGRAVRLLQGKKENVTDYGAPVQAALHWQDGGASVLHVVDLDGAFSGRGENLAAVSDIVASLNIPVELGGGIRTMADIEDRLSRGVWRVILGTAALEDPELTAEAAKTFPGQVAVGIDALNGRVAVKGWVEASDIDPVALALRVADQGIQTVIYTDISKDGMLTGPNIPAMADMVRKTGLDVVASGGVGRLEDLQALSKTGVGGVIVGKALYEGAFTLAQALAFQEG